MSVRRHAAAPDLPRRTRWAIAAVVAVLGLSAADRRCIVSCSTEGAAPDETADSVARIRPRTPAQPPKATRQGAVKTAVSAVYELALPALTDPSRFEHSVETNVGGRP